MFCFVFVCLLVCFCLFRFVLFVFVLFYLHLTEHTDVAWHRRVAWQRTESMAVSLCLANGPKDRWTLQKTFHKSDGATITGDKKYQRQSNVANCTHTSIKFRLKSPCTPPYSEHSSRLATTAWFDRSEPSTETLTSLQLPIAKTGQICCLGIQGCVGCYRVCQFETKS